jgi:hypothetical protein
MDIIKKNYTLAQHKLPLNIRTLSLMLELHHVNRYTYDYNQQFAVDGSSVSTCKTNEYQSITPLWSVSWKLLTKKSMCMHVCMCVSVLGGMSVYRREIRWGGGKRERERERERERGASEL